LIKKSFPENGKPHSHRLNLDFKCQTCALEKRSSANVMRTNSSFAFIDSSIPLPFSGSCGTHGAVEFGAGWAMEKFELATLSLAELKDLQKRVAKAITDFEANKRAQALEALEETAKRFGYSVSDLTRPKPQRTRVPAQRKFANPENSEETWSGRGRTPKWFAEALKAGKSFEDLKI
jgi:DNA-binding protein H-NS